MKYAATFPRKLPQPHFLIAVSLLLCSLPAVAAPAPAAEPNPLASAFVHPGLLHTTADLDRIRARLRTGSQPWQDGFEKLQSHPQSKPDWRVRGPFAAVVRGPRESRHIAELEADANAAYQNALLWCLTGNPAHAGKALEILNAWAFTLRKISGHDRQLAAALCGFKLVNAAELLRHSDSGWQAAGTSNTRNWAWRIWPRPARSPGTSGATFTAPPTTGSCAGSNTPPNSTSGRMCHSSPIPI